jgi:hypothetical protein
MTCDSFTSTWQNELFETYEVSPVQAMCGVNFFSFLLTSVSLLQQVEHLLRPSNTLSQIVGSLGECDI